MNNMNNNLKYFKTIEHANGYLIEDIPFVGYIDEIDVVLYCDLEDKMIIIENNYARIVDKVDIIFNLLNDANGYIIESIPLSCYIKESKLILECNEPDKMIIIENNYARIVDKAYAESKLVLSFNSNVRDWFLEDNINGHNEYYQIENLLKVKIPPRPTFEDHYIEINGLQNKTLTIYNDPKEYSQKCIKRRSSGLVSVDMSYFVGQAAWCFWDGQNYPNLKWIKFPTIFTGVRVDMDGYFNNIVIPASQRVIFGCMDEIFNVKFENEQYEMRIFVSNRSTSAIQKIIDNMSNVNIGRGIIAFNSNAYNNLTNSQKNLLISKNMIIRLSTTDNERGVNWDFE